MAVDPAGPDRLPCGTDLDTLLAHLRAGAPTAHERTCPHCRAAARDHAPLSAARDELAADTVTAPPNLLDDVMRVVRSDPRSGRLLPVAGAEAGTTHVRRFAAAALLRTAAEEVPGVARVRVRDMEETGDGVAVRVAAHLRVGAPIPETSAALRRAVRTAGRAHLGWHRVRVDIEVTGIADDPAG
ncbi:Asp23/Gls24 family envelope stress response protein [Nocardiopsis trehalosi]|jgi:hypothetical protein|uniref:hypothetical protein n=1 Tax=Nocardiopsis trehalosi TaxID=109329 RepID=UPI00082F5CAA|nr:hypothetical protein [Nocardiopsis trehalosi]